MTQPAQELLAEAQILLNLAGFVMKDTTRARNELVDRISAHLATGGWTKCSDALPDDLDDKLVVMFDRETKKTNIRITSLNFAMTGFYVAYDDATGLALEEVTHWRELPAPPKEC